MSAEMSAKTLWPKIVEQGQTCNDPILREAIKIEISPHSAFDEALAALLAEKLADRRFPEKCLHELFLTTLKEATDICEEAAQDLLAVYERDPACLDYVTPFLSFKGFHAIEAHRIGHRLWKTERLTLALHLQSRVNERFGMDIHPGATFGHRLVFDHGTGIVIGETSIIEDDVSLLQGVTLGGTGKHAGDRHPKIRRGVLIGAGAIVLGNIEVGIGAKIGAGSVVLDDVPPFTTVVGNPARRIGKQHAHLPALEMDQRLPPIDYTI